MFVERAGNALPHPASLFGLLALVVLLVSWIGSLMGWTAVHPATGQPVEVDNLVSVECLHRILLGIIRIYPRSEAILERMPTNTITKVSMRPGARSTRSLTGFIAVLFLITTTVGIAYGVVTKKFRSDGDVIKGMTDSFKTLVSFLVLVFFAAQFVAWFRWSNLGLILAIDGANWLQGINMPMIPLMVLFILFSAFLNMFMGSASAKWAILAPVFVPMFMLMGYSPELSQAVYRIGDSVTNIISPMMSFFALIIVYFEKYDKQAGIGTLISTMLPYSISFFVVWIVLLIVWILTGLPLGPGSGIFYNGI